ncbi:hypothetical protein PHPALM_27991 [Phytophthora palmivora]|uniref:Reverse transcriptase RNase H-like domain-containing protein n=1 Tax=Phytophthora palmivora TaxID=4796 RepID=A0A2P4XB72_9STRA|nr:hypothetical protein PHPALM_27991 [Phytophthora palmivora]
MLVDVKLAAEIFNNGVELLSVVEIIKGYRTMLLGFPAITHTDHKNVLYISLRDKRCKLLLEIILGCGFQNIGADAFPRLRYDYVKQATEQEIFVVGEEHRLADSTIKTLIARFDQMLWILITRCARPSEDFKKRVVVPNSLRNDLVGLNHEYLLHPGGEKQYRSMTIFW